MVTPELASARIMRHTLLRATGSSPVVGSSRNKTLGVTISEAAISRRRRMPPEYSLTCFAAASDEIEGCQQLVGTLTRVASAKSPQPRQQHQVLATGEIFVERRELSGHRDLGAHLLRRPHQVMAHDAGAALIRTRQRCQHAHQRRLAGAVGAEDGEYHAPRHFEIDAVNGTQIAEALDEAACLNGECL